MSHAIDLQGEQHRFEALLQSQDRFFASGATSSYEFRAEQLRRLRAAIQRYEAEITQALQADFRKPELETYVSEIAFLYGEIDHTLKHLRSWMKPRRVASPITLHPATSHIYHEPLGRVLIIGAWNYPLNLVLAPLLGAIAAGNCAVIKPSEVAPHTSALVARIVGEVFAREFVAVVEGGPEVSQALLKLRWDYIFFTGGTAVGRIVARAAAEHMTPVTLELGGKSPCIVDEGVDLSVTARRIVWGKFFNGGQTCVAPDYLLVHESVKEELIARMREQITAFFGSDPATSPDFARIINDRHFERLVRLLGEAKAVIGGTHDRESRYIAPTVLDGVELHHRVMQEEIFGPILPVLTWRTLDEAIATVRKIPDPLALYVFSGSRTVQDRLIAEVPFGGGCVNDVVLHFGNPNLPVGGIRGSGTGRYHGKYSFETFSHKKGIVKNTLWLDVKLRYQPYLNKLPLLKRILG